MSPELIGILGVGATLLVGLGGLLLVLWSRTDKRLDGLDHSIKVLSEKFHELRGEVRTRFTLQDSERVTVRLEEEFSRFAGGKKEI